MVRGFCSRCGREVGGFLRPPALQCMKCRCLYCGECAKEKVGIIFKRAVCPDCRIELRERARLLYSPRILPMGMVAAT